MKIFRKINLFVAVLLFSHPGILLANSDDNTQKSDITLTFLDKGMIGGSIAVTCSDENDFCDSTLEFEPNTDEKRQTIPSSNLLFGMQLQGHLHRNSADLSELGSISARKNNKQIRIPLSIDYSELDLGEKNNPITRALISALHPSMINHANKVLYNITEVADYLTGNTKSSDSLHLFKPKLHKLHSEDHQALTSVIHDDFLVLDIGESYTMVIIFNVENLPTSIYVLDRWRLYRDPLFKTLIGYSDLIGLVLHGVSFIRHGGTILGIGGTDHLPNSTFAVEHLPNSTFAVEHPALNKLVSIIGAGFHIAEIIDHTHGVGEFISGSTKHYQDHDHHLLDHAFGVMHLAHTAFEMIATPSIPNGIQILLTTASFGYHHVPQENYEYSMSYVLRPVVNAYR